MEQCGHKNMKKLYVIQNKILRSIYDWDTFTSNTSITSEP